jgi:CheY-like chemotaxis protein
VASTNALAAKALAGVSVLLVEDDSATRDALAILLRDHGMNVRQAESAETAIHAFEKESPDLILSDIAMPGADGYTLIRSVRAMETSARRNPVPAIALTAFARDIDRRLAVEAGFQMHLGKPIDTEELIAAIQNVMLAN